MKSFLKSPATYIVAFLCFVSVIFFIRCYEHQLSNDELLYQYVWEKDDPTDLFSINHRFERKISSFTDIVQTQTIHYVKVNGRSVVHAIEQAFTGHMLAFSIINTAVFLLFVWLIVYYVSGKWFNSNYALWVSVVMALLLLFPYQASLWTSVNYGPNYLWTATMAMGILIIWDKIIKGEVSKKWNIPIIILSAVFGWTHEGFVVGLAGGIFLYYCLNFKTFRKQILYLAIPMFITAAIMVFAPGNISRFFVSGDVNASPIRIFNGANNMLCLWVFRLFIIGLLILIALRQWPKLRQFLKDNIHLVYILGVTFAFTLMANTAPYSHTFMELISLLLILRYLRTIPLLYNNKYIRLIAIIATLLFIPHQVILAKDTITNYKYQSQTVQNYITSPDGIFVIDHPDIAQTSVPYIRIWGLYRFCDWTNSLNSIYFKGKKRPSPVTSYDYPAIAMPDSFFVDKNKFPGNAPVYKADKGYYMWLKPGALPAGAKLQASLYPVDWNHKNVPYFVRLKFVLMSDTYPSTEILKIDTIQTRFGEAYQIDHLPIRKIKSIDIAY